MRPEDINAMFEAKVLLERAQKLEVALDQDGWDGDMEVDEVLERGSEIDKLYRAGFDRAQQVSAQFYEEQATVFGFSTPLSRELHGFTEPDHRAIEDLQPRALDQGFDGPSLEI
jgi:hypothetical protein